MRNFGADPIHGPRANLLLIESAEEKEQEGGSHAFGKGARTLHLQPELQVRLGQQRALHQSSIHLSSQSPVRVVNDISGSRAYTAKLWGPPPALS
jgi:hypothetical protein